MASYPMFKSLLMKFPSIGFDLMKYIFEYTLKYADYEICYWVCS